MSDPEFDADFIRSKSAAAAGLCAWAVNIVTFFKVYCEVEPKRLALEAANQKQAAAQEKLRQIQNKINALEEALGKLTAEFEKATSAKLKCQQEAETTGKTIELANRLVGGLASENVRWAEAVKQFKEQEKTIPGDVLLITAYISYMGCFTKSFRLDLMNNHWLPMIQNMSQLLPITEGLDPLTLLTDDASIATWNNEGLPSDR